MKLTTIGIALAFAFLIGCTGNKLEEKGFSINSAAESEDGVTNSGINQDSLVLPTRPSSVLNTAFAQHRLTSVYLVNRDKRDNSLFIGSNRIHGNYVYESRNDGNRWNENFMPGIEAVYGYNLVNVSHYNTETKSKKDFFKKPVLVKTLYYPAFSKDTLNFEPVVRNYYMVSVYDEDTNGDGFINIKDLRRFYHFDIDATVSSTLIPKNYSVLSSQYDSGNDYMYVFTQFDENGNGGADPDEAFHVFWIDLKDPLSNGRVY